MPLGSGLSQEQISKAQTEPVYPETPSAEIINSNSVLAPWPVGALYLVRLTCLPQDPCGGPFTRHTELSVTHKTHTFSD